MSRLIPWVAILLTVSAGPVRTARAASPGSGSQVFQERGASVGMALLVQYFDELPAPREGENRQAWGRRLDKGLVRFKEQVAARYSEATLGRLSQSPDVRTRRAAVLALGLLGTMESNPVVAELLTDEDANVRQTAAETLWAIWFRADTQENNRELRRLTQLTDPAEAKPAFEKLLRAAPTFAEAYNQRAILHFRLGDVEASVADCQKVLSLNPYHFGAQAGLAQCYMKLRKPRAALRAFRLALRLNPNLTGVGESIRALEEILGEEGQKDDKK